MKTIIGIDPGSKGFVTILNAADDGKAMMEYLSISDTEPSKIADRLRAERDASSGNIVAVMEEIHAVFGSSAKATFAFGEIFGLLKGMLVSAEIPYNLVPPKVWQAEIWNATDKTFEYKYDKNNNVKKVVNTKATSERAARRLFPREDFRRTPGCKKNDDNKIDSLLIAEYGRRKNL